MANQVSEAYRKIKEAAATVTTDCLYSTVRKIGGNNGITSLEWLLRSACLDLIEERDGESAVDALMEEIGL